jgi:hypothetical protein
MLGLHVSPSLATKGSTLMKDFEHCQFETWILGSTFHQIEYVTMQGSHTGNIDQIRKPTLLSLGG